MLFSFLSFLVLLGYLSDVPRLSSDPFFVRTIAHVFLVSFLFFFPRFSPFDLVVFCAFLSQWSRGVDLVTALATPLTYEGLIDDLIGIENG